MIESFILTRPPPSPPPTWTRPPLPRGPAPAARRFARLRARLAALAQRKGAHHCC